MLRVRQGWGRGNDYDKRWVTLGCRQHAWGEDLLLPVSGGGERWMGLGLTLVDALDTLLLMNLTAQFAEARAWITADFDPDQVRPEPEPNLNPDG